MAENAGENKVVEVEMTTMEEKVDTPAGVTNDMELKETTFKEDKQPEYHPEETMDSFGVHLKFTVFTL